MLFHRIAPAGFAGKAREAFSGKGGLLVSGRWHTKGRAVVYASQQLSLAMAEVLVHLQRSSELQPFVRWEIEIPDKYVSTAPILPSGWERDLGVSRAAGDAWLASAQSPALLVPSVLVALELNCLINPTHPKFDPKWIRPGPVPFAFDGRLVGKPSR